MPDPLAIAREEFWRHTDRNPADDDAVITLMGEAMRAVHERHDFINEPSLVENLVTSLDPQVASELTPTNAAFLEELGTLVGDSEANRAQQWGALSLMGVLAMTGPAEETIINNPEEAPEVRDPSAIARKALAGIIKKHGILDEQRALAEAFLTHHDIPGEDVAIELLPLVPKETTETPANQDETVEAAPDDEPLTLGASMSNPTDRLLWAISTEAQERFNRMDWIRDFDFGKDSVPGRDIYHDGQQIATVVDLTGCNTKLKKYAEELYSSHRAEAFWNALANSIIGRHHNVNARGIEGAKVPTYATGTNGFNDNVTRGYYVPLGTDSRDVRLYGLVAAFRTKAHQIDVMRQLSTSNKRIKEKGK